MVLQVPTCKADVFNSDISLSEKRSLYKMVQLVASYDEPSSDTATTTAPGSLDEPAKPQSAGTHT